MAFNFGETELKYPLPPNYKPICLASDTEMAINTNEEASDPNSVPVRNSNAPQAIIIEVNLITMFFLFTNSFV